MSKQNSCFGRALSLVLALSASALADECGQISDKNKWYIAPDGYAVPIQLFDTRVYDFPVDAKPIYAVC